MTNSNENKKSMENRQMYLEQLNEEMPHCKIEFIGDLRSQIIEKKAFIVQDITGIVTVLKDKPVADMSDKGIVRFIINEGTDEEKLESIQKVISAAPHDVVCADVFVSEKEFPELKMHPEYLTWGDLPEELYDRMKVALNRDVKIYEKANFVNINNYVNYEYKVAMVYANDIGQAIVDEMNKIVEEFQKEVGQVHVPPRPRYI